METRSSLFSCGLLGTFLFLSSAIYSLPISDSAHELSHTRHLLSSTSSTPNNIIQQYLRPHNKIRSKLGLPPLQWSEKLAGFASRWAHQRQRDCTLIHSNCDYGENLFWGSGKDWKPGNAVAAWTAEKSYYNYHTNTCLGNRDCLHYTQVVWRQSLRVGCAKIICTRGDTLITCNYDPHELLLLLGSSQALFWVMLLLNQP